MSQIILLGVGTGVPDAERGHTHMVWVGPGGPLLIDAGGSTYQRLLQAGVDPQELSGMLLTHSHPDHINGLPALLFSMGLAGRSDPLPVYGLASALEMAAAICEAIDLDYSYVTRPDWRPIDAGSSLPLAVGWVLHTALTAHSRPCLALRFEEPSTGLAIAYSADTEPCAAVARLAIGASVLIHEATTPEPFSGHTSPRQAGEVAAAAGVGQLVLVHFSPRWTMPEDQALDEVRAGGYTGPAAIGRELMVVSC